MHPELKAYTARSMVSTYVTGETPLYECFAQANKNDQNTVNSGKIPPIVQHLGDFGNTFLIAQILCR